MNWKKLYDKPKPGDKIRCIRKNDPEYEYNEVYTLKHQYIKNGVWLDYNKNETGCPNDNVWDTVEIPDKGLFEKEFELV